MNFLNIFFKKETVVGLCSFEIEGQPLLVPRSDWAPSYQTFYIKKPERVYQSNFDKNVLLI